jgi:capsular polysaccharide transport system permease protein
MASRRRRPNLVGEFTLRLHGRAVLLKILSSPSERFRGLIVRRLQLFRRPAPAPPPEPRDVVRHYFVQSRRRANLVRYAFLVLVLLPTSVAGLYFGLFASDRYVSEARFIVRGIDSPRASGMDLFFRTFGISRAVDDSEAVQSYVLSRDAVRELESLLPLREIFSREDADVLSRFPRPWRGDSFERLYEYYLERVFVTHDPAKGLTQLKVITFDPDDSLKLAQALVGLAEARVNRMNERAREDTVRQAQAAVKEAEQRLVAAQMDLTNFRTRELVVDPTQNSASVVETITNLSKELAQTLAQIEQSRFSTPSNPVIPVLQSKSEALRGQIAVERDKLGGGASSLSNAVSTYERLTLLREIAEKSLSAAETDLESARQEARRQQIYVEEVVRPNLSDKSTEPQRMRAVATLFVTGFAMFALLWILFVGAREHAH